MLFGRLWFDVILLFLSLEGKHLWFGRMEGVVNNFDGFLVWGWAAVCAFLYNMMHILHYCIYFEVDIVHKLKTAFVYLLYFWTSFGHFLYINLILSQLLSQGFLHSHPFALQVSLYLFYILLYLFWLAVVFDSDFNYLRLDW